MDVVTHGMMGVALAAPFAADHPEASAAFMLGSVLPDADVLSRLIGKRAFLRAHQTWTHGLPVLAVVVVAAWGLGAALGMLAAPFAAGLGLGILLHLLLDYTSTYGTALGMPFSRRRACREWVFFIDLPVIVVTLVPVAMAVRALLSGRPSGAWPAWSYAAFLAVYWALRAGLHRRAWRLAPEGTGSLQPTPFLPWKFLGARPLEGRLHLFDLDALSGRLSCESVREVHDASWAGLLEQVPEYRIMRELSPLYYLEEVDSSKDARVLICRDPRHRQFDTRFGELRVELDTRGTVRRVEFHV